MRTILTIAILTLAGCASGPTPMDLALERGERLDECVAQGLDCREELGEWADFTEHVPPEQWREYIKRLWEFTAAFEEVFGPGE